VTARRLDAAEPFRTLDGSSIREWVHPRLGGVRAQSVAEATVDAGARTERHRHPRAEEVYLGLTGAGTVDVGGAEHRLEAGVAVVIPPGSPHHVVADDDGALVFLCVCAPAYADDDTVIEP
jgi:mannose-6-phosphate isomerase-like protein (cupin superfamily)